jgi:AraC family transcriptional regulator
MNSSGTAHPSLQSAPYPHNLRRVLGKVETHSIKIEKVEYAAGFCLARHSQAFPFLACTLEGVHWSSHGHGGHVCRPGTVRFLPAGEPHENYFPSRSRCLLVKLRDPLLERAREFSALPRMPGELASPTVAMLCKLLHRELRHNDDLSPLSVDGLSLQLLLAGAEEPMWPAAPIPAWLRRTWEMLHEESASRLTLAELARRAGRHPVQVCRQFHYRFQCTIGEYVRRLRVGRAQSLLASSELDLAEIALACGFSDQSHFSRAFRRLTGMPPRQFQKQITRACSYDLARGVPVRTPTAD